jgi:hypothetical protein
MEMDQTERKGRTGWRREIMTRRSVSESCGSGR